MNLIDPVQTGGIIAVVVVLANIITRLIDKKMTNGNAALSKHQWELRTHDCANHQVRQERQSEEMIAAIREQTAELRHVLNRGFNIEDTQPGKRTR